MKTTVRVGSEDVEFDSADTVFTEATVNEFLRTHPAKYDYLHTKHAEAVFTMNKYEDALDSLEAKKFVLAKTEKGAGSDNMAKSMVGADEEVVELKKRLLVTKRTKDMLWGHLRAMDRAFEASKEMCYNLRKEMDKLNPYVMKKTQEAFEL